MFISLEYCEKGDLFEIIKKQTKNGGISKSLADNIFMQILDAVDYMHSHAEVAHLDLKLENILINKDYEVKLCDLGFSQSIHNKIYRAVGTDKYKAPEIHKLSMFNE